MTSGIGKDLDRSGDERSAAEWRYGALDGIGGRT